MKFWATIIGAVALVAVGFLGAQMLNQASQPSITMNSTTVAEQLTECSELATVKLEYRGLVSYEEGDIALLTKKAFSMVYDADVRAGVDLAQASVAIDGNAVRIELPHAAVQSISIDPDSLEFYDEKFALFNWQDREDTATALQMAQDDAQAKVDQGTLLADAEEQARTAVEALLAPFTEDGAYTLDISFAQEQ